MWCGRKERLGKVGEARRGPQRSSASVHRGSSRSEAQQPSEWPPTGCLQGILQETQGFLQEGLQFFYRMFWNGMFEDGWLMEDAWMVMEVGWGSEVTQELMDGVVRWYVEGWFGFKVVETTIEKKVGLRGKRAEWRWGTDLVMEELIWTRLRWMRRWWRW